LYRQYQTEHGHQIPRRTNIVILLSVNEFADCANVNFDPSPVRASQHAPVQRRQLNVNFNLALFGALFWRKIIYIHGFVSRSNDTLTALVSVFFDAFGALLDRVIDTFVEQAMNWCGAVLLLTIEGAHKVLGEGVRVGNPEARLLIAGGPRALDDGSEVPDRDAKYNRVILDASLPGNTFHVVSHGNIPHVPRTGVGSGSAGIHHFGERSSSSCSLHQQSISWSHGAGDQ
jgi:hypothetical protein